MNYKLVPALFILIPALSVVCGFARAKSKVKLYQVSGTVLITHDYCGGARLAEDQVNKQTYPVAGTTLYICRQGSDGNRQHYFDSIVCDSAGHFTTKLPAGKYCFVQKWRTEPLVYPVNTKFETWDTACYRQDYNNSDFILTVKGKMPAVKITLRRYCSWTRPCCTFTGPLPPSAPPTNRGGNQPGHQE